MSQNTSGIYKILTYPFFYSLWQKIMSGELVRATLVKNIINKNNTILDIGCGPAKILESLPEVKYYGYDINTKHINYAKKKYNSKKNIFFCKKFSSKEIKKLPKFDLVLLFGIMHHLENKEINKIFLTLKKVLKKNGKLITCDPVFIKKQNFIAYYLVKKDAGNNVRNKNGYLKLINMHFKKVKFKIKNQKFIPYTWFYTSCEK